MRIINKQPDHRCDTSIAAIDVGFDLRTQRMTAEIPADSKIVGYSTNSNPSHGRMVEGSIDEILCVLRSEGYQVVLS